MNNIKNIHKECGWYDTRKIQKIIDFCVEVESKIDMEFGFDEIAINGYCVAVMKDIDGDYIVDITANRTVIVSDCKAVLSHAIATTAMNLNGFKGNYSMNGLVKLKEMMMAHNNELSSFYNSQW